MHTPFPKLAFEQKLAWLSLLGALPSSLILIWLLYAHQYSGYLIALVVLYLFAHIGICAWQIRFNIVNQFRTLTNLLEALSNEDYTLRGRSQGSTGALNELITQINSLSDLLAEQRYTVKETQLLLAKVIAHIDVAVFTFDSQKKLTLVNRAGAALYQQEPEKLQRLNIHKLGLAGVLQKNGQVVELSFSQQNDNTNTGRFHISTDQFVDHNEQHTLLFLTNVQAALREEERRAWQNLIRVISHELNNSLAPIASISQTLLDMRVTDTDVLAENLGLINERASSLSAFIQSYQQLAKLPAPNKQTLEIRSEIQQVTSLFPDIEFQLRGEETHIQADASQLRQCLINLFKNAKEAMQASGSSPQIYVTWQQNEDSFTLTVKDTGPGIKNPENLFVPFYSTKPGGSGIGLLLCRQIAEAHGGQLNMSNSKEGGCVASLQFIAGKTPAS